jgi:hypothetical protein
MWGVQLAGLVLCEYAFYGSRPKGWMFARDDDEKRLLQLLF